MVTNRHPRSTPTSEYVPTQASLANITRNDWDDGLGTPDGTSDDPNPQQDAYGLAPEERTAIRLTVAAVGLYATYRILT